MKTLNLIMRRLNLIMKILDLVMKTLNKIMKILNLKERLNTDVPTNRLQVEWQQKPGRSIVLRNSMNILKGSYVCM